MAGKLKQKAKTVFMKKMLIAALAFTLLAACGNNAANNSEGTASGNSPDSPATQFRGIENVNGNIPDSAATGAEPNANYHTDSAQ